MLKRLVAKGSNVNARTKYGWTPLHDAVLAAHGDLAEILIDNEANVNAPTDNGVTPLHVAVFRGHEKLVNLLIANGAHVNAKDTEGRTALYVLLHEVPKMRQVYRRKKEELDKVANLLRNHGATE